MPRVTRVTEPTVDQSGANAGYQQIGGVSDDAFGGAVARALTRFGEAGQDVAATTGRIVVEQQERENAAEVLKADNQTGTFETDLLNDLYTLQGTDAISASQKVMEQYDAQTKAIRSTLTNPVQQDTYDKMISNRRGVVERSVVNYRRTEGLKAATTQAAASAEINMQSAIRNRNDPVARDEYLRRAVVATRASGKIQGVPNDVTEVNVNKVVSDTHEQIIGALAAENPRQAMEYYANYKTALTGEADVRMTKLMDTVKSQQGARDTADEAQKKFTSVAEQIKYIDEQGRAGKLTADEREKAKSYVQNDFNLSKLAQEASVRETSDNIIKQIDEAKASKKPWSQIEAENINGLLALSSDDASRLKKYYEYKVEGVNSTTRSEQLAFYNQYLTDLADPKVNVAEKYTIDQVDRLSPDQFRNDMLKSFAEAKSGSRETSINLVSNKTEMDGLMKKLGVKGDDEQLELRNALQLRIEAETKRRGKDLTPSEVRKLTTEYATSVVTSPGWVWNTDRRVYQIATDPMMDISKAVPPSDAREEIIGEFLKVDPNAQPSEQEINETYRAYLRGLQGQAQ